MHAKTDHYLKWEKSCSAIADAPPCIQNQLFAMFTGPKVICSTPNNNNKIVILRLYVLHITHRPGQYPSLSVTAPVTLRSARWASATCLPQTVCGSSYPLWLLLLLELLDGFLGLLQLSTGLLALLFDCSQLPFDQVVFLCLLSSSHLSLWT